MSEIRVQIRHDEGETRARNVTEGTTAADVLGGDRSVIAARVDGALRDLSHPVQDGNIVEPVLASSEDGLAIIRHSCAHVMAQAVQELFPSARLGIGPPIKDGFYYDFDVARPFTPEDLTQIEERMRAIVRARQLFARREVPDEQAREELATEPYKLELIDLKGSAAGHDEAMSVEVGGDTLTIYDNIDPANDQVAWKDLCRGPHLPSTHYIPAFKLMRSAAAYWRGSEKNPQLQRIYGTAWESKESLANYLHLLAEAEKRDHRKIGKDLELFHFDPTAPGMPYWLPKGLRVLNNLLAFWREEHEERGYQEISTPLVNNKRLWEISGHWDHYRDNMFIIDNDNEESSYALKPMNCPNAMVVFNLKTRSYRDLPLRLSDCDHLHRNERSGTLHGLLRVQKLQQDDAHIFITPDQIHEEFQRIFDIADRFYKIFDLNYKFRLGTRPESYIGDAETWEGAEATLLSILDARTGGDYEVERGGGAFYGPKIDILMSDALGRPWQMGTIQLDFQLPRRFGCVYTDEHGQRQTPVVIHRVIYGALERFLGIYIEHTAGAFPLWLAPVQVSIIPVAPEYVEYAHTVADALRHAKVSVELDARNETLGMRVRVAQQQKVPLMLVLGAREAQSGTVSVRRRGERTLTTMDLDLFVDRVASAVRARVDVELPRDTG